VKQEASSCYCDISLALHTRFLVCTPHTRRGLEKAPAVDRGGDGAPHTRVGDWRGGRLKSSHPIMSGALHVPIRMPDVERLLSADGT